MAKRFTDTEMWDKEWFMALSPKIKCLVKYVRDKCDIAGIWSPNFTLASLCVGEAVTEADLLQIDGGEQFVKIDGGKIYCLGFVSFQYGEKLNPASPVHKKILAILDKNNIPNRVLNRVCNTLKEEEEEKEVDKEEEKEQGVQGGNHEPQPEMPMGFLMDRKFREINTKYPQRPSKDMPAITEWAEFINEQSGSKNKIAFFTPDERTAVMDFWVKMAEWYRDTGETNDLDYLQKFKLQKIYTEIQHGTKKITPNYSKTAGIDHAINSYLQAANGSGDS